MKALSILQPWAWAIASGNKAVENRAWCLPPSVRGQLVALHASKSDVELRHPEVLQFFRRAGLDGWPRQAVEERGAIVGLGVFARCVHDGDSGPQSRWYVGPHGFWLSN